MADARQTRQAIVRHATDLASHMGLEGVTIGRLASDLGMSKAGVLGHFGSKEALQLAALDAAVEDFVGRVWVPAASAPAGLQRLRALCDTWLDYLASGDLPGGCFLTAAACEFDGRPGPVRDAVATAVNAWLEVLAAEAETAIAAGELPESTAPVLLAFELNAFTQAANQAHQLLDDPAAFDRAREAVRLRLVGSGA